MTFADYQQIKAVNWSTLREMRRSPLHYRHRLAHAIPDAPRLALGRAIHTAVLEPELFASGYAVYTGGRRAGKDWDAFEAANADKTVLKIDEYANVIAVRDAVLAHPVAMQHLSGGAAEQTLRWTDPDFGIECKARPDYIGASIVDLKSTKDAGVREFGRTAARFGYHCQLQFYRRGARAVLGRALDMVLVAVEAEAPHDVAVYRISGDEMYAADEEINRLLDRVAQCRRDNRWPGAHEAEQDLAMPEWALASGDEDAEELTSSVID